MKYFSKPGNVSKIKHFNLSIAEKVELIRKLESGCLVKTLFTEYEIGSTAYDIKRQELKILQFYLKK